MNKAEEHLVDGDSELSAVLPLYEKHLELQSATSTPTPYEYNISNSRKLIILALYFVFNLGLTLSNKGVMQRANFPWLLTVMHTTATSIGCFAMAATGRLKLSRLDLKEHLTLVAFSLLFTLNIAVSNVSLALVSVPFHQVLRSTCPVATMLVYKLACNRSYSRETYISMVPLVFGVGMATFGDYYFTLAGFLLTLLGVLLAALKGVATNQLMTESLNLGTFELLFRMSPLAAVQCFFYAAATGELSGIREATNLGVFTYPMIIAILTNAIMAFLLNVISFEATKLAGALTAAVCGNLKQVLTILLGIILFHVKVTSLNGFGMLITVIGTAYYSSVEMSKTQKN
ncbi:hypothetical protein M433DRAFT_68251 [Acidomyces richmondensis BFW]|nr:MAG: hypothetical protein FE78DRAFT_150151 [Acidomyces sp. 'richmondensis']KYG44986.1 hypothetical protein M433DRAFT_68251 [Acidomyces richmondensis BFW]